MTATNHALTGAVIALAVKQPALAIPLAFVSHFLADMIPHFNARTLPKKRIIPFILTDLIVGTLLAALLPFFLNVDVAAWVILASMVAAMSPDYIWCWRFLLARDVDKTFAEPMSPLSRMHSKIQREGFKTGLVEVAWLAGVTALIVQFS